MHFIVNTPESFLDMRCLNTFYFILFYLIRLVMNLSRTLRWHIKIKTPVNSLAWLYLVMVHTVQLIPHHALADNNEGTLDADTKRE